MKRGSMNKKEFITICEEAWKTHQESDLGDVSYILIGAVGERGLSLWFNKGTAPDHLDYYASQLTETSKNIKKQQTMEGPNEVV